MFEAVFADMRAVLANLESHFQHDVTELRAHAAAFEAKVKAVVTPAPVAADPDAPAEERA